jgi:6-pyruvoyltetrahydropterin/6-carboxytetrahydropterin synthase
MILLTRKADFSAAHFYWNPAWSEAENFRVFGKCANRLGHGHNYTLEVTVAGEIDPVSGFVVDLKHPDDREHCDCHLAAARGQDSEREAVPCARV